MPAQADSSGALRWRWILTGVILATVLLAVFIRIVDPALERPEVSGLVATLTLMLVGIVIGRFSAGETIREAGVAGVLIFALVMVYLVGIRGATVPGLLWVAGPLYVATFAMMAAWVGEMLQGTLQDAHDDRRLDWPWVFVSVVCGFLLEAYALFLGAALFAFTAAHLVPILLVSVLLTGWFVGFFSPGFTAVEPALASVVMVVFSAGLAALWLADPLPPTALLAGTVGGLILGLAGGWLGEITQSGPRAAALRRVVRGV